MSEERRHRAAQYYGWAVTRKGGPGSGNYGHAGRKGMRGGSLPRVVAQSRITGKDWERRQAIAAGREPPKEPEEEPKGVQVPQFETWQEAQAWAEENDMADNVDYKGYDPAVCNAINQSLAESYERMPELRTRMQFLGSSQARNRHVKKLREPEVLDRLERLKYPPGHRIHDSLKTKALNYYVHRVSGNTWAMAFGGARRESPGEKDVYGIGFNDKWCKGSADAFKRSVARNDTDPGNYHPVGTGTLKAIVDHEIGHHIGAMLGANARGTAMHALYRNTSYAATKNGLSEYGAKNIDEFIAEGWGEFINNPNPRPLAQQIGTMLMGSYQQHYGGG